MTKEARATSARGEGRGGGIPANRDGAGRFRKGVSGNPSGRRPINPDDRALLEARRSRNIRRLLELTEHADPWVSIEALKLALAYDLGKPVERQIRATINAGTEQGRTLTSDEALRCYQDFIAGTLDVSAVDITPSAAPALPAPSVAAADVGSAAIEARPLAEPVSAPIAAPATSGDVSRDVSGDDPRVAPRPPEALHAWRALGRDK